MAPQSPKFWAECHGDPYAQLRAADQSYSQSGGNESEYLNQGYILSKTSEDSFDLIFVTFTNESPPATYSIWTAAMATENVEWALVELVGHGVRLGVGVIESRPGWDFAEERQQSRIRRLQIPLIVNHIEPISNIGLKITLLTPSAFCQIAVMGNLEQFSNILTDF